jgi:hypothetical protein
MSKVRSLRDFQGVSEFDLQPVGIDEVEHLSKAIGNVPNFRTLNPTAVNPSRPRLQLLRGTAKASSSSVADARAWVIENDPDTQDDVALTRLDARRLRDLRERLLQSEEPWWT